MRRDGSTHLPVTRHVYVEERDLFGLPGCNVRVRVLSRDDEWADVLIDDCGVRAVPGERHAIRVSALNGGRR